MLGPGSCALSISIGIVIGSLVVLCAIWETLYLHRRRNIHALEKACLKVGKGNMGCTESPSNIGRAALLVLKAMTSGLMGASYVWMGAHLSDVTSCMQGGTPLLGALVGPARLAGGLVWDSLEIFAFDGLTQLGHNLVHLLLSGLLCILLTVLDCVPDAVMVYSVAFLSYGTLTSGSGLLSYLDDVPPPKDHVKIWKFVDVVGYWSGTFGFYLAWALYTYDLLPCYDSVPFYYLSYVLSVSMCIAPGIVVVLYVRLFGVYDVLNSIHQKSDKPPTARMAVMLEAFARW